MGQRDRRSGTEQLTRVADLLGPQKLRTPDGPQPSTTEGLATITPEDEEAHIRRRIAADRKEAMSERACQSWLESVGVGQRLREFIPDRDLIPDECAQWAERYHQGAGMILAGPIGSGKTSAAVWCLRSVYYGGEVFNPDRLQWAWRPAATFYTKARDLYRAVFERNGSVLARARAARVLVIDEWGGAYDTEWPLAEMDGIIDDRWERRLATILTTNLHPTNGDDSLGATAPRALDRLCDEPGPGLVPLVRQSLRAGNRPKASK